MKQACTRPFALTLSALSLAAALSACGGEPSAPANDATSGAAASATAASDQVLRIASARKDKATLTIEDDAAFYLLQAGAIETLVRLTPEGQVQPALATQWRRTGDTSWEFDLRSDVKFHDGSTLDAEAVATSLNHIMQISTPPRALKSTGLKAEVVDADTVKFTTDQPDPVLPLRFGGPNTAILAKGAYAASPANPIGFGSGPYKISQFDPGVATHMVRFDDYWGGKPQLGGVEMRPIMDPSARFNALKAGEVHIAFSIAPSNILEAQKDSSLRIDNFDLPRTTTLYTNVTKPALKNEKIRQALDLLIDREAIAAAVLEGMDKPARGYFGSTTWAPQTPARPADAVEQAKRLLAESGVAPADLKLNLMTYTGRPELAAVANVIKDNLEQAGFAITVDVVDYVTVLEPKLVAKQHDLILLSRSYYTDMPDLAGFLASDFGCEGSYNLNVFCDKAFDALWQSATQIDQPEARTAIFVQAAQYLNDHKVGLPIYNDTSRQVSSTRVQAIELDPLAQRLVTHQTTLAP